MNFKYIKIIFFSFVVLCSFNYYVDNSTEDKILWEKAKKLKWDDFQGKPDLRESDIVIAKTKSSIEIVESSYEDDVPVFKIHCFFLKKESWTVVDDKYTLSHEQLHFDISEIYARKIRKKFDNLNKNKVTTLEIYQKAYDSLIDDNNRYNELYDSEVYFNDENQKKWYIKIANELEELNEYSLKCNKRK